MFSPISVHITIDWKAWSVEIVVNKTAFDLLTIPAQSNFVCPNTGDGYYEDPVQCDKYYDCYNGVSETRLCPDGLVFDPFSRKDNPCDHYFNVDCGDRLELRKSLSLTPWSTGHLQISFKWVLLMCPWWISTYVLRLLMWWRMACLLWS